MMRKRRRCLIVPRAGFQYRRPRCPHRVSRRALRDCGKFLPTHRRNVEGRSSQLIGSFFFFLADRGVDVGQLPRAHGASANISNVAPQTRPRCQVTRNVVHAPHERRSARCRVLMPDSTI